MRGEGEGGGGRRLEVTGGRATLVARRAVYMYVICIRVRDFYLFFHKKRIWVVRTVHGCLF